MKLKFCYLMLLATFLVSGKSFAQTSLADDFTTTSTWTTLSPSLYSLSNSGGTLKADAKPGIKYETFDYPFAEINVKNSPLVQIDIKSATTIIVRIDLLDFAGHTTNTTDTKISVPGNNTFSTYIFDFTGKFSQTYPSDSATGKPFVVDAARINKISLFINPSGTASTFTGSVYFDNLKIGSNVVIPPPPSGIRVNQIGFYPDAPKVGVVAQVEASKFYLVSESGADTVYSGDLPEAARYAPSGELVALANFSQFKTEGSYTLNAGAYKSPVFKIGKQIHNAVSKGLIKSFYFNRASTAITGAAAEKWPRPYFSDISLDPEYNVFVDASAATATVPAGAVISSPKGWFDAGDYNKYVVNAGISTYSMLALYEHFPSYFDTLNTKIPESGLKLPDILDEAVWELEWLLTTQTDDGSVYHKITESDFCALNLMPIQNINGRLAVQRGTAAACDFAAVLSQASRILSNPSFDGKLPYKGFADTCLNAAKRAYAWAAAHPTLAITGNAAGINTGTYADRTVTDELAWARMELFVTTKDPKYYVRTDATPASFPLPGYTNSNTLGLMSLVNYRTQIADALGANVADTTIFKTKLLNLANSIRSSVSGYGTPFGVSAGEFFWGSNSGVGNQGMILLQAYRITKDPSYLTAALANLDYLLGRNATGYCFVTGYGSLSPMTPHHRISNADKVVQPIPGMLVGGPNGSPDAVAERVSGYPTNPARSYLDVLASHSTNEPAINYTAAGMYLANGIEAIMAGAVIDLVPVVKGRNAASIAVELYPNPSRDDITLEFANNGKARLTISDVTGKVLMEKTSTEFGQARETLSVSGLQQGIYFISVTTDLGAATKKLIKN